MGHRALPGLVEKKVCEGSGLMRAAHIKDLPGGFGRALQYFRSSEFITAEMLARTSGIGEQDISRMERGEREPTLSEFLRLALAIPVSPSYLFNRAVTEWPDDPRYAPPRERSLAHYPRLFRLAWIADRRVIHESRKAYETFDEAQRESIRLNPVRERQGMPLLVGVGVYIRMGNVWTVRDFLSRSAPGEK
jgi:transcriptional regulator with XRE-family HTH domain